MKFLINAIILSPVVASLLYYDARPMTVAAALFCTTSTLLAHARLEQLGKSYPATKAVAFHIVAFSGFVLINQLTS